MPPQKLSSHWTGAYRKAGFYSSFSRRGKEEKVGTYLLQSMLPNSIGKEAQVERQSPGKASKKLNPQEAVGFRRDSMPEMEPKERDTPASAAKALPSLRAAPLITAEPSVWLAEAPQTHKFLWLTKCDCYMPSLRQGEEGEGEEGKLIQKLLAGI